MKQHKLLMQASLVIAFALASPHVTVLQAQATSAAPASQQTAADGVSVYGHTLYPQAESIHDSVYSWDDLARYMPTILPDADQFSLNANEVCERFNELNDEYLAAAERSTGDLMYKMEFVVNQGEVEGPADMALTNRLASGREEDMNELFRLLPNERAALGRAKTATEQSFAMIMLYNAALKNCPSYAREKGLYPVN